MDRKTKIGLIIGLFIIAIIISVAIYKGLTTKNTTVTTTGGTTTTSSNGIGSLLSTIVGFF